MVYDACSNSSHRIPGPRKKGEGKGANGTYPFLEGLPSDVLLELHTTPLLTSDWLELNHMAISGYNGSWGVWPLTDVLVTFLISVTIYLTRNNLRENLCGLWLEDLVHHGREGILLMLAHSHDT